MVRVINSSQEAFSALKSGNERFASGLRCVHALSGIYRMEDLATNGQKPFAIILSCSDSRAPAETLFDQGLGDLFVVRVAGNVVNSEILASIEFATSTFGSPICVVMGHTKCGAVSTTHKIYEGEFDPPSTHLNELVKRIMPSVEHTCKHYGEDHTGDLLVEMSTEQNVRNSIEQIKSKSEIVNSLIHQNKLRVIGAIYDISTGKVNFMNTEDLE
jgi:carbonic anhydrase